MSFSTAAIAPKHFSEFLASAIAPELARLNFVSLADDQPHEYLLYGLPRGDRRNDGRLRDRWLRRYRHTEQGGWWCDGVDPATGKDLVWGCFKPDQPRWTGSGDAKKRLKYEHPPKVATEVFALRVPEPLWEKIAQRYKLALPSDRHPEQFWPWVVANPQIPLVITEGAKKAAALLSAGYAAIGLPGIFNGYRQPRDDNDQTIGLPTLIPMLQVFGQAQRPVYFAFDQDQKLKTRQNTNIAIAKTGKLLERAGCCCRVITWDNQHKGADDLIVAAGTKAFDKAFKAAENFGKWQTQQVASLSHPASVSYESRYLPPLDIPAEAQLVAIKSPKGTGKTEAIAKLAAEATAKGQRVLVLSHRVQLAQLLCDRFGIDYVTELRDSDTSGVLGYGLCVDSLHDKSVACFDPAAWAGALVIVDEAEQVLWHLFDAKTEVRRRRVAVLNNLHQLVQTALGGGGRLVLADADLSDIALDYFVSLTGSLVTPWLVVNDWQPGESERWSVFQYDGYTPGEMFAELQHEIRTGGVPFICTSGQKAGSRWGTRVMERAIAKAYPDRKILRIDAETVADPEHPAYGCISRLNEILPGYDVVICSPAIETGVSIDIRGHFTSVWGFFQGNLPADSCRQMLARLREPVPRHLWARQWSNARIGDGSMTVKSLLRSQRAVVKLQIALLGAADAGVDTDWQPQALKAWARRAAVINLQNYRYREAIATDLAADGNLVTVVAAGAANATGKETDELMKVRRDEEYDAHCQAIADAPAIETSTAEQIASQRTRTADERHQLTKWQLQQRYGLDVTPELVHRDDDGWYSQMQLLYYLTTGREELPQRDHLQLDSLLKVAEGAVFAPDCNHELLSARIHTLEWLGIPALIGENLELTKHDAAIAQLETKAHQNQQQIRAIFGVTISDGMGGIQIAHDLLKLIGLRLNYKCRRRRPGRCDRVYTGAVISATAKEVLQYWSTQASERSAPVNKIISGEQAS
ncbi:MAG: DUF3854 domain-containing protein [Spirulinaceae cyanobacterium RM2_2_10]|nr:DUF3854 domain-containing protein [Spirulinaceae cyanobacterium SM2_1_0]NJO19055.1 DUF3854 domain-containing protein [Spirulinaceae cyanobacterium RM2_2_10]